MLALSILAFLIGAILVSWGVLCVDARDRDTITNIRRVVVGAALGGASSAFLGYHVGLELMRLLGWGV